MARLIDAYKVRIDRDDFDTYADYITAVDAINDAPTVDAVPAQDVKDVEKERDYWHEKASSYEQTIVRLTESAVPVRHGKWNCGDDMFEYAVCSCCKHDTGEAWEYAKKHFKYCPNCGADMREVDEP